MNKSFTLMEMLIVVAILGILAAIILPQFQSHTQQAREATAKDNLRILRNAIELYAVQHDGIPPGYPDNDLTKNPEWATFILQLEREHYFSEMPSNPFNNNVALQMLLASEPFPPQPDGQTGWIYKPQIKAIKLNWPGIDSSGIPYYNY
jgi:general secretion pathway protein G